MMLIRHYAITLRADISLFSLLFFADFSLIAAAFFRLSHCRHAAFFSPPLNALCLIRTSFYLIYDLPSSFRHYLLMIFEC